MDKDFDPALGFTRRNGFRRVQPTVSFSPRPRDLLGLRQLQWQIMFEYLMDMQWNLETRKTDFKLVGLRFDSGDRVDFDVTQLFERLEPEDEFTISDVTIPAGSYNTISWRASARTAGRRIVSANVELRGGEFWSGSRTGYEFGLTARPRPGFSVSSRKTAPNSAGPTKNDASLNPESTLRSSMSMPRSPTAKPAAMLRSQYFRSTMNIRALPYGGMQQVLRRASAPRGSSRKVRSASFAPGKR